MLIPIAILLVLLGGALLIPRRRRRMMPLPPSLTSERTHSQIPDSPDGADSEVPAPPSPGLAADSRELTPDPWIG